MRRTPLLVLLATVAAIGGSQAATQSPAKPLLADFEAAPAASARLTTSRLPKDVSPRIDAWFERHPSRRVYLQVDRPMVRPGEAVWIKSWNLATRGLAPEGAHAGITYELLDPRGNVVETRWVEQQMGAATNDFVIPEGAPGGLWKVRATDPMGAVDERPIVVASYAAPRVRKELDFVREAYGPGDKVEAVVKLEAPGGGPFANRPVRALFQVDGETLAEKTLTTDAKGNVYMAAVLPADLGASDGLLTVLVDEGGVTESISRAIPIVQANMSLAFFPEGGDLVAGLPGRVYFEGKNAHGEPADVVGVVEDETGKVVAQFSSIHDGLGRFGFTPAAGKRYTARITEPAGIDARFELPEALANGCTLRSFDDVRGTEEKLRVAVRCNASREVLVVGTLREKTFDAAPIAATPWKDAVVYLDPGDRAAEQGAARVTVFDKDLAPLAERLVYRNPGKDLKVEVTPAQDHYGPRDEVVLNVKTTDPSGKAVPASLALAVVDDAALALADDEEGHMLSRIYLEPELVESPDDPAWYFDHEEVDAARGLDLVMGTKGWRRFDWVQVWTPEPEILAVEATTAGWGRGGMWLDAVVEVMDDFAAGAPADRRMVHAKPVAAPMARPMAVPMEVAPAMPAPPPMRQQRQEAKMAPMHGGAVAARERRAFAEDELMIGLGYLGYHEPAHHGWAPVRVFPKPDYKAGFTGERTDFRDTVLWEPTVTTGEDGKAEVRFYLSDAVTTFRVTAEGVGAGLIGHGEATFASKLPVSLATRLPAEVSAGDHLILPVTVTNTRANPLDVKLGAAFDSPLLWASDAAKGALTVAPGASRTWWLPVDVGHGQASAGLRLSADAGGLGDQLVQQIKVAVPGFPRSVSAAGELTKTAKHSLQVDDVIGESLVATVTWHPSPVSTLISGMEGLIRTPGGCFEQTSSTNWPNVAILSYLEAHDGDPALRLQSGQALDAGYQRLTGYQVQAGGFETFGSGPGKEALSAFGLLQFADMKRVYPVSDDMQKRNADYLLSQRDGQGGFRNSGESAHGYGAAPKPVLDGFITWALVSTGHGKQLAREVEHQASVSRTTKDPYVLALAVRSLRGAGHPEANKAAERLASMQAADGSFPGAESSITRSYEANLLVESTALAASALMESGLHREKADKAASWLVNARQGHGTWGATQATALALGALTQHADLSRRPRSDGKLWVEVNGERAGELSYTASQTEPLVISGLEAHLRPGANTVVLRHEGGAPLPYTLDVQWRALNPESAPDAELAVSTRLDRAEAKLGETVRLTAKVTNRTDTVQPSPIARIGLPAGLEAQTWQLKQLQERGQIAFFETGPREVVLYWEGVHAKAAHEVKLDLLAAVPGTFTGPASSAWPYYDDDEKAWDAGMKVKISPN